MRVGSLFSGIGGFELGLERAGMRVVWQSEIDPYASAVLRKHWPDVPNHGDIRNVRAGAVEPVDLICGGFPCQPHSSAARGRNKVDGCLWREMRRVISELRPAWVVCENVTQLDRMALESVALDLEILGYEVGPPLVVPACAVGQDHRRDRYWICGYTDRHSEPGSAEYAEAPRLSRARDDTPSLGKTHGVSKRMERLGNAIVPQIAEIIGRAIMNCPPRSAEG